MIELKTALGQYMARFYGSLYPATKALAEFSSRGLSKSIVYAPSRMVDAVEDMLASWRKNDNSGDGKVSPYLPVIMIATAKDYLPAAGDFSIQLAEAQYVILPGDAKERVFKLRQMQGDRRTQVVICAADEPTARSLASQFAMFVSAYENRRFTASYRFAGLDLTFPVMLETTDVPAINVAIDQKNITILAIDITLKETIPIFYAPKVNEQNDGKGSGTIDDPSGYPVSRSVSAVDHDNDVARITE